MIIVIIIILKMKKKIKGKKRNKMGEESIKLTSPNSTSHHEKLSKL